MNKVYLIDRPEDISAVADLVNDQSAIVADGHHRLEASRKLAMESEGEEREFWSNVMVYITSVGSLGLTVSGIDKILKKKFDLDHFLEEAEKYILLMDNPSESKSFITFYADKFYNFVPRGNMNENESSRDFISPVHALNNILFQRILQMDAEEMTSLIEFTHDDEYAVNSVRKGKAMCAFLLPQWNKEELFAMVLSEGLLPQKSTFYHPKLYSGIVMNSFLSKDRDSNSF